MSVLIFLGVLCAAGWSAYVVSWLMALKNNSKEEETEVEENDK